jgi:hypothetical protein
VEADAGMPLEAAISASPTFAFQARLQARQPCKIRPNFLASGENPAI